MNYKSILLGIVLLLTLNSPVYADELPDQISIPSLHQTLKTEALTVTDGQLSAPMIPTNVGLYQVKGNLIVVGHRDMSGSLEAFSDLPKLQEGDRIFLSDGRSYHVVWSSDVSIYDPDTSYLGEGNNEITIFSCYGDFSVSQHRYQEIFVVKGVLDQ